MTVLSDVRVLDLGRYIAAPYCTMMLADLGADVIRVERPGGEADRDAGLLTPQGDSYVFAGLARGKRAVTLDLRHADARPLLDALIARSDVVVHNFDPATARRLALDYDGVRVIRPDVVHASISCFGEDGPAADRTGFDPMAQAASGAMAVTGPEGGAPIRAGVPWVDYATGLATALGVVTALRHRDRTGEGQAVTGALLRTAVSCTAPVVAEAAVAGQPRPRLGNQPAHVGVSNLYRCADGAVYVAAVSPPAWRRLAEVVGRPDLARDATLSTPAQRYAGRHRVDEAILAWTTARARDEVLDRLQRARVPCAAYREPAEVLADEQVTGNDMLATVDLGPGALRRVPASATPVRLSAVAPPPAGRPPRAGEHNDAVYGDLLGLDAARRTRLLRGGAI